MSTKSPQSTAYPPISEVMERFHKIAPDYMQGTNDLQDPLSVVAAFRERVLSHFEGDQSDLEIRFFNELREALLKATSLIMRNREEIRLTKALIEKISETPFKPSEVDALVTTAEVALMAHENTEYIPNEDLKAFKDRLMRAVEVACTESETAMAFDEITDVDLV